MIQEAIVGIIVLTSVGAVLRRYLPRKLRSYLINLCGRFLDRIGLPMLAAHISFAPSSSGGCGDGCGNCASNIEKPGTRQFSMTPDDLKKTIRRP